MKEDLRNERGSQTEKTEGNSCTHPGIEDTVEDDLYGFGGKSKADKLRLSDIVLPSGLHERYIKGLLGAAIVAIAATIMLVYYGTIQCCIGYVIAGAVIYLAVSIKLDYAAGKIDEVTVICVSASQRPGSNNVRVSFRTDDDVPTYYEFFLSGKAKNFAVNHVYVIYFRSSAPRNLIAYVQL